MLTYFFHEAAAEQRFVDAVHHVGSYREPERKEQWDLHTEESISDTKVKGSLPFRVASQVKC